MKKIEIISLIIIKVIPMMLRWGSVL